MNDYELGYYPCGCDRLEGHVSSCLLSLDYPTYMSGFFRRRIVDDHHQTYWVCRTCGCLVDDRYTDKHRINCKYEQEEDDE